MTDHITPEELRACADAEVGNALGDGRAYEAAAATIEALQAEVEQLHEAAGWLREQEESLRADIEELDKENQQLRAVRDGLAATLEQVRAWLAGKPTAALHDIVAAAPSVSLAHVKAETLRAFSYTALVPLWQLTGAGVALEAINRAHQAANALDPAGAVESEASNG